MEQTTALATVSIIVLDVNDNSPAIAPSQYSITLLEDASTGVAYAKYVCSDADENENGQVSFSILSGSPPGLFTVSDSGHVFYSSHWISRQLPATISPLLALMLDLLR